jgi:RNA polymerase sigma-70 factor (ECF subfamily)
MMDPIQAGEKIEDTAAVSRILAGETELYEVIIRRYNGYLYKVGKSYGYTHADVEDLMQETYLNAYIHLAQFESRSSFKTWIVRIMLNQCYHKRQKFSFRKETPMQETIEENSVPMFNNSRADADKAVQNLELKEVLEKAVQSIPESYRIVFTLRELDGMSVRETSEALDITESNVKVRFIRAKSMLQQEIRKVYSPGEIFEFNLIYCDKMVERVMRAIRALA